MHQICSVFFFSLTTPRNCSKLRFISVFVLTLNIFRYFCTNSLFIMNVNNINTCYQILVIYMVHQAFICYLSHVIFDISDCVGESHEKCLISRKYVFRIFILWVNVFMMYDIYLSVLWTCFKIIISLIVWVVTF